jgi:hypothetical protein
LVSASVGSLLAGTRTVFWPKMNSLDSYTLKADGRQSETAFAVQRGVARLMRALGFSVLTEFTLASARRADVIGLGPDGSIWIIEIKSSINDFRADTKWQDYADYCDRFYFAIPATLDAAIIPDTTGLIVADSYGAEIIREAGTHVLHASRRKALTLEFGRMAAHRLHSLYDP